MSAKKKQALEPTFEQAFTRLEEIVGRFEAGELPLEQTMELFEEGSGLVRLCRERLEGAQQKLARLLARGEGEADPVD